MSLLRKTLMGLKPYLLSISNPNLKGGVIECILKITVKQLPRPLGWGLWEKPVIEGF